jgi:hypothetical protein
MFNASAEQLRGLTACFSKAVCGIGGTPALARFTAPNGAGVDFSINGIMYHKADADDVWTLSGDDVPINSECIFLLCLNASGTMSIVQGESILTADLTNGSKLLKWPQHDVDVCPIGAVRVTTTSTVFVPGTTSLAEGATVDTYYDFSVMPAADLTS